ncbi:androglobin-like [Harpegnathos saltator]|uniref:androglobin-like n=1 Tax=Harpegnathos saltator TaxID=610380 RepID=UPI000DBEEBBC|nr:androglobin-like [Harpegnathos saltator]
MGCWRRIAVDDIIPIDQNGTSLLPRTSNNTELWPMLLAKALLKIASLTWTERREIVDFHPISCLTGWTCLTLNIAHLSWQDKWDFLTKYCDHFVWSPRTVEGHVLESSESIINNNTAKPNKTLRLLSQAGKPQPITLFLQLGDMRKLGNDAVPGLSPCWDHVIHVVQSRDIPLNPKDVSNKFQICSIIFL